MPPFATGGPPSGPFSALGACGVSFSTVFEIGFVPGFAEAADVAGLVAELGCLLSGADVVGLVADVEVWAADAGFAVSLKGGAGFANELICA